MSALIPLLVPVAISTVLLGVIAVVVSLTVTAVVIFGTRKGSGLNLHPRSRRDSAAPGSEQPGVMIGGAQGDGSSLSRRGTGPKRGR